MVYAVLDQPIEHIRATHSAGLNLPGRHRNRRLRDRGIVLIDSQEGGIPKRGVLHRLIAPTGRVESMVSSVFGTRPCGNPRTGSVLFLVGRNPSSPGWIRTLRPRRVSRG